LTCVNDKDNNSDEEEVYAQHGEVSGDEFPPDDKLFENYFNFDDEDYLVRNLKIYPLVSYEKKVTKVTGGQL
jgi:hypothetical protein